MEKNLPRRKGDSRWRNIADPNGADTAPSGWGPGRQGSTAANPTQAKTGLGWGSVFPETEHSECGGGHSGNQELEVRLQR